MLRLEKLQCSSLVYSCHIKLSQYILCFKASFGSSSILLLLHCVVGDCSILDPFVKSFDPIANLAML